MRKTLVALSIAVGLAAGFALAGPGDFPASGRGRHWGESQAVTRAAPTLATEGMSLGNVSGFRVSVCANQPTDGGVGALTGTGNLRGYYWDPYADAGNGTNWRKNAAIDFAQTGAYVICQTFADLQTSVPYGRVLYAADTLANDGGSGVTVTIDAKTVPQ